MFLKTLEMCLKIYHLDLTNFFLVPQCFRQNYWLFEIWLQNTTASMETFTKKWLGRNFALHFTSHLSIALSKILPRSKTIKNAMKLLVFGKNDSHHLSNVFQTNIFWNFDHISRTNNLQENNNSYHEGTSAFFLFFFSKETCRLMMLGIKYNNTTKQ